MNEHSSESKPESYFCEVKKPNKIAILISGQGSNARNIIEKLENQTDAKIVLVVSTRLNADMAVFCGQRGVVYIENTPFNEQVCLAALQASEADMVVLAGFLKKIGPALLSAYPNKIINIHPSLLPKFGGKGMYGAHVHQAVFEEKAQKSGITIHLVNENFDEGEHLAQFECTLTPEDSVLDIEAKVRKLEAEHFAEAVLLFAKQLSQRAL